MTAYPSFPVAGNTPIFLNAFDPSFMGGKFPVAATDPPAFGVLVGQLSALPVATSGGAAVTSQQWTGFCLAWATSPGFSHILPFYMPQRFGPKYNMVVINGPTDGGGT